MCENTNMVWNVLISVGWVNFELTLLALSTMTVVTQQAWKANCLSSISKWKPQCICQFVRFTNVHLCTDLQYWQFSVSKWKRPIYLFRFQMPLIICITFHRWLERGCPCCSLSFGCLCVSDWQQDTHWAQMLTTYLAGRFNRQFTQNNGNKNRIF